jgi:hypothetical protein
MSIVLMGSTSGSCTLQEQAVAGTTTLTLPTISGTVGVLVSGTAVATTSGTSIDFTGIPAEVRRITVIFAGVSTNGASTVLIQIGDSGGIETTGYVSTSEYLTGGASSGNNASTIGFVTAVGDGATVRSGHMVITHIGSNLWVSSHTLKGSPTYAYFGGGDKTLSSTLDRIRLTTTNGTDTFDAGSINIMYE